MLVLAMVWWAWGGFAWLTNSLHSDDGIARIGLLSAMGAMLITALAVPGAFGEDSVVFGLAYFAVRAIHIAVYSYGAPDTDDRDAILKLAPGLLGAPLLIAIGGFLDGGAQAGPLGRRGADRLRHALRAGRQRLQGLRLALPRALRADRDHRPRRGDRRHRQQPRAPPTLTAGVVAAALAGLVIAGRAVVGVLRRRRARRRPAVRRARRDWTATAWRATPTAFCTAC